MGELPLDDYGVGKVTFLRASRERESLNLVPGSWCFNSSVTQTPSQPSPNPARKQRDTRSVKEKGLPFAQVRRFEAVQNVGRNAIPTNTGYLKGRGMRYSLISNFIDQNFLDGLIRGEVEVNPAAWKTQSLNLDTIKGFGLLTGEKKSLYIAFES
jgi:hypothetical protein